MCSFVPTRAPTTKSLAPHGLGGLLQQAEKEEEEEGEEEEGEEEEGEEEEEEEEPPPKKKKKKEEAPAPAPAASPQRSTNRRGAAPAAGGAPIEPIAPRPFPRPLAHPFCPCARRRSRVSPGEMKCYEALCTEYIYSVYILGIF